MKTIPLSRGFVAIIDDEDYEAVSKFKWHCDLWGYVCRGMKCETNPSGRTIQKLHRFLMNPPKGIDVDHINMDRLDNRRANLRLATRSQNFFNKRKQSNNRSGVKGVFWEKSCNRWRVQIRAYGKRRHIGVFTDLPSAAAAYAAAARELHGEFARLT